MPTTYHSTALQTGLYGEETTHGTPVTANTQLAGTQMNYWSPEGTNVPVMPSGYIVPTGTMHTKEWSQAPVSGMMNYGDLRFLVNSGLIKAAPASGVSTHTPLPNAINSYSSYTVNSGDSAAAYGYSFVHVQDFGLTFDREQNTVNGQLAGQREDASATLAVSPTVTAMVPVPPQLTVLKTSSTFGGSYTKVPGAFTADLKFSNLHGQVWTLDDSAPSFTDLIVPVIGATASLSVVADTTSGDYLAAPFTLANWRTGGLIYAQVAAAYDGTHALLVTMCLSIVKLSKRDMNGHLTLDAECTFAADTAKKWVEFVITSP